MSFATPDSSPPRRATVHLNNSFCETPPLNKKQRLLSPSPQTPDKSLCNFRPTSLFSQDSPSPNNLSFNSSSESIDSVLKDSTKSNGQDDDSDVMMLSPPRLERLQLFDYPRTPLSIARSSGLQVPSDMSAQRLKNKSSLLRYAHVCSCVLYVHVCTLEPSSYGRIWHKFCPL